MPIRIRFRPELVLEADYLTRDRFEELGFMGMIRLVDESPDLLTEGPEGASAVIESIEWVTSGPPPKSKKLADVVNQHTLSTLRAHGYDQKATSTALGINAATLYRWIEKHPEVRDEALRSGRARNWRGRRPPERDRPG